MAERIDNQPIYAVLGTSRRLASLEGMRGEMRDGFASLRAHLPTGRESLPPDR